MKFNNLLDSPIGYPAKIDLPTMKSLNSFRLMEAVRRLGPISRADLVKESGLSAPTVSALVTHLKERKLILEVGKRKSSSGRRPMMLRFNERVGCLVGIDLEPNRLQIALTDCNGSIIQRQTGRPRTGSPANVVSQIQQAVRELVACAPRDLRKILAVAIGVPGMTDCVNGVVLQAANLPGWVNVPLRLLLEDALQVPALIDNDVNMAALGEHWKGRARDEQDFAFIYLGTGIGAGLMLNGRLHRGHNWYAGEIKYMTLNYRDRSDGSPGAGYLECRVGAHGLEGLVRKSAPQVASFNGDPSTVFEAIRQGLADDVAEKVSIYLGVAVANLVSVIDPALVVFGGDISQGGEPLLKSIWKVVASIVPNRPRICLSSLGDEARLYGSIYSALQYGEMVLFDQVRSPAEEDARADLTQSRKGAKF